MALYEELESSRGNLEETTKNMDVILVSLTLCLEATRAMDHIPKHPLLKLPADALKDVRKIHNLDGPGRMNEALGLLEDWVSKQTHFVKKDFSRVYLEKTLIACKGSVEKAKKQLDRLCTMRSMLPKFFTKTNVKKELTYITQLALLLPLPNTTEDYYRPIVLRINAKSFQPHNFLEYYQYNIILCEYMKRHDYVNGFIMIEDFRNINLIELITKMNTVDLQQLMSIVVECYGARMRNIYFLSESKAIELLVNTVKQFLSKKISSRVHVISNLDELHKHVPREILPSDYGGMDKSTDKLVEEWVEALSADDHVEYMKMMNKACTDESLRETAKFNEDYMGMPGSFRNLNVD